MTSMLRTVWNRIMALGSGNAEWLGFSRRLAIPYKTRHTLILSVHSSCFSWELWLCLLIAQFFSWNVSCLLCSIFKLASSTWQSAFRASQAISVTWSFIDFNQWLIFYCQLSTHSLKNTVATSDFWPSKIKLLKYSHTDVYVKLSFQFIGINAWRWD